MQKHLKTAAKLALGAACAAAAAGLLGCEKQERVADKKVRDDLAKQQIELRTGSATQATAFLKSAKDNGAASAYTRFNTKSMWGQNRYGIAVSQLPAIARQEAAATSSLLEIERMAQRIASDNLVVAGFAGADPNKADTGSLKAFSENHAKAGADLSKAEAQIRDLTGNIESQKKKITDLQTKKQSSAAESATLLEKSEQATGQVSVDLYNKSIAAKQEAALATRDLAAAELELSRLERSLKEAEADKTIAQEASRKALEQMDKLKQGWDATVKLMSDRKASSKSVFEAGDEGIAARAKKFSEALAAAKISRDVADQFLTESLAAYEDAIAASKQARNLLQALIIDKNNDEHPAKPAWQRMQKLCDKSHVNLLKGKALAARGELYLNLKNLLELQQGVEARCKLAVVDGAKLPMPPEISNVSLGEELQAADAKAKDALAAADETLKTVADEGIDNDQKNQAAVERMSVAYAQYQRTRDKQYLDTARQLLSSLAQVPSVRLPLLPADLEEGIVVRAVTLPKPVEPQAPTTAPATQPTTAEAAPATLPADGAAPVPPVDPATATPPADGAPTPADPATPAPAKPKPDDAPAPAEPPAAN